MTPLIFNMFSSFPSVLGYPLRISSSTVKWSEKFHSDVQKKGGEEGGGDVYKRQFLHLKKHISKIVVNLRVYTN